ncbi:MAG: hypothetical protein O7D91_03840, partial [Planctomycetota bacterium]|nr:hypothetical protein [Planctomycetota bacterium]
MHVLAVIRIRSLLVAAVLLASSATTARADVSLDAPNGGEVLEVGSVFTITWHILIAHDLENWNLWYLAGGSWTMIAMNLPPGSGEVGSVHTYDWTVPDDFDDTVWVLVIMDNSGTDYPDISDAPFSIVPAACPEDLDGNGTIGAFDLAILLGTWGSVPTPDPPDFDGDGDVDAFDLAQLLGSWGPCGGTAAVCYGYCVVISTNCTGAYAQYSSPDACLAYCNDWAQLPAGSDTDTSVNTIGCRIYHAESAETSGDYAFHCPHAGPSGGNYCGTWCENYCYLAMLNCTGSSQLYGDLPECMDACAFFPDDGMPNDTSGDTVQCRIHHLGQAGSSPGVDDFHCPHGSADGG